MSHKIINRHLSWISKGYDFEAIQQFRREILCEDPAARVGTEELQYRIAGEDAPATAVSDSDLSRLSFLWVEDSDFDGELGFLKYARNIENICISGKFAEKKISDIRPVEHLKNLKQLHLDHHHIENLRPLSSLDGLRKIDLYKNRFRSIAPLSRLTDIERAKFSNIQEEEVFGLLENSNNAIVSFTSTADGYSYIAFWINDWAFKGRFIKEEKTITTLLEPINGTDGRVPLLTAPENLRGIILKSQEIAASLLDDDQELTSSDFTFVEKYNELKGSFGYACVTIPS